MIRLLAELAAIGVLLVGFGVVIAYPGLTSESRGAAAVAVVGGLVVVSRLARREHR